MKENDVKGRNDYDWHPELTETQIDEFWAEGILPGSQEYRMKLGNFGIKEDVQPPNEPKVDVDLDINKKTGACKIISKEFETQIEMDASDYSKKGLKKFRKELVSHADIAKEDLKYIKNIDPTIYKAYQKYDLVNKSPEGHLASKMYMEAVIKKSKAVDEGKIAEDVQMPGKVNVDIGWHPSMKNAREKTQKFRKIRDFVGSFRANKILKNHGAPSKMNSKRMDLAKIADNRKVIRALILGISWIPMLGAPENSQTNIIENIQKSTNPQIETQGPMQDENFDKDIEQKDYENENINPEKQENQNSENESSAETSKDKKDSKRIYPGDLISAEQYSLLFNRADAKEANGALTTKEMLGVNKIACVINGQTYSSIDYSADEIYKMAEDAGVEVRCHVDKAIEMDGKICVQIKEKNNPAPTFVYNENGIMKTMDGEEWTGDTEYSSEAGWMNEKDIEESNIEIQNKTQKEGKNQQENEKNQQKMDENEK